MKLLRFIKDKELPIDASTLEIREASRAVIFDDHNLVPILFVANHHYHKLPGGGIEEGENQLAALHREMMEEVGSKIKVIGELGKIIEYRSQFNLQQTSYCYLGKITSKGLPSFTAEEISNGFTLKWLSLDDAISMLNSDKPNDYEGQFIKERDLLFLETAKQIMPTNPSH